MKIYIAADHAGFELKKELMGYLRAGKFDVVDMGAFELNIGDDYPDFVSKAADAVSRDPESFGIVIGGSGQAEAMVANKFKNVRAALFYGPVAPHGVADATGRMSGDAYEMVRLMRLHNDANILSLGARFVTLEEAKTAVDLWLSTKFEGGRHLTRLAKIAMIESGETHISFSELKTSE